jgi:hypothetical protein
MMQEEDVHDGKSTTNILIFTIYPSMVLFTRRIGFYSTELPDLNEAPLLQDEDQSIPIYQEGEQATGTHNVVIFELI